MDFFKSQESLTTIEWILRGIVSYIFLLIVTRLMGQRSISQLRFLDFVIALILGNIMAHPLSDENLGLKGSMITTFVLIALYIITTWLGLNWSIVKNFLDPPPITLVKNGQIQFKNLTTAKISLDFLFSELRKDNIEDIQKVSLALWEPGGTISIFKSPQYQPVTPNDLKLKSQPFNLVKPIILEGKIDMLLLKELGKDLLWLKNKIAPFQVEICNVPLATIDEYENVQIYNKSI